MENGQLRIDVNVSVHKPGTPFGTRCEIKNINSVRFLQQAIQSERRRHIRHYESESKGEPLQQETRQFDEVKLETYSLRSKEEAEDYRYMPDANLPAMVFEQVSPLLILISHLKHQLTKKGYLDNLRKNLPEMPWDTVDRLTKHYGVSKRDVETLLGLDEFDGAGVRYFEQVTGGEAVLGKRAINW
jgi:aspartyl-tRNA(Asn)/glutamyl-tRNA(Gln) amidotransferase subunit B